MGSQPNEALLETLATGALALHGEFVWGSNYTFLLDITCDGCSMQQAVYKPTRGTHPLWDFSATSLARRETAAYLMSEMLGWELVPPTVYRRDGPFGPGSLQLFIDHDPEYHYFNFSENDRQRLGSVVAFDLLANNADRKGSHILVDINGHFWLIDHGLCFHAEDKLRTVIWDFAGEPIPADLLADITDLQQKLAAPGEASALLVERLHGLLTKTEIAALAKRAKLLAASGVFPQPQPNRRQFPWPPV